MHVGDGGERRTLQAGRAAELRLPRRGASSGVTGRPLPAPAAPTDATAGGALGQHWPPRHCGPAGTTARSPPAARGTRHPSARVPENSTLPHAGPLRPPAVPPRLGSARWGCWQVVLQETDSSGHWFSKRKKQNWPDPQSLPAINWEMPQRGCDALSAERGAGASQPPGGTAHRGRRWRLPGPLGRRLGVRAFALLQPGGRPHALQVKQQARHSPSRAGQLLPRGRQVYRAALRQARRSPGRACGGLPEHCGGASRPPYLCSHRCRPNVRS